MCKPRILIVDDQPENLQILIESLKNSYTVMVAISGYKALEISAKEPRPDLVLLDIIMPEINGFEVCSQLKANPVTSGIPVIFVTVMEAVEDIMLGFQTGGVDYITKPYRIEEVKARVATHIQIVQQKRALEEMLKKQQELQALTLRQARLNASGQLIQNIAHQWRQPLSSAMLEIDLLLDTKQYEGMDEATLGGYLERIKQKLFKMSEIITSFGTLFRPDEEPQTFSPVEAVQKALWLMEGVMQEAEIKISSSLHPCTAKGYPNEYIRVVVMILDNAKEMLLEQKIAHKKIDVRLKQLEGRTHLTICDNAGGIREGVLGTLFEPYVSTKFASFGVGLDLFMSKILIDKHMGGELSASNSGSGACFTIVL